MQVMTTDMCMKKLLTRRIITEVSSGFVWQFKKMFGKDSLLYPKTPPPPERRGGQWWASGPSLSRHRVYHSYLVWVQVQVQVQGQVLV